MKQHVAPAEPGWSSWSLEKKLTIVIIPITVAVIALMPTVVGALFGDDEQEVDPSGVTADDSQTPVAKLDVPRYDGVVGNFEGARAFITFLEDNDGESVQLVDVGFNDATSDDFIGDVGGVAYVQVFSECDPPIPDDVDPDFAMGCLATSFQFEGAHTEDTQAYLTHGVPVYDGFFRVDVSGTLQMGVSPIFLEPLTREEATTG